MHEDDGLHDVHAVQCQHYCNAARDMQVMMMMSFSPRSSSQEDETKSKSIDT